MKHKVSELEGALLDAAVAKADGAELYRSSYCPPGGEPAIILGWGVDSDIRVPPYSSSWLCGGPIIERERIELRPWKPELAHIASWTAMTLDGWPATGHTPLIAAMRAYVASKLGDEIEL